MTLKVCVFAMFVIELQCLRKASDLEKVLRKDVDFFSSAMIQQGRTRFREEKFLLRFSGRKDAETNFKTK